MSNPLLYYARNKKKAIAMILILSLSVFAVSLIITLIVSSYYADLESSLAPLAEFTIAREQQAGTKDIQTLSDIPMVGAVYEINLWQIGVRSLFGGTASYMLISNSEHDAKSIYSTSQVSLVSGHLPGIGEVIVHQNILTNWDTNIGDTIFGGFTVVGAFTGDARFSLGVSDEPATGLRSFVLFPYAGGLSDMNRAADRLRDDGWGIMSYSIQRAASEEALEDMLFILSFIIGLVGISIAISVGALAYTMYLARLDEFAILSALGYKKSEVSRVILAETLVLAAFSWILGQVLALGGLFFFEISIFRELGQNVRFFTSQGLLFSIAIVALVVICAVIPTVRKLSKTDLVAIIG